MVVSVRLAYTSCSSCVQFVESLCCQHTESLRSLCSPEELACGPEPLELLSHMFLVGTWWANPGPTLELTGAWTLACSGARSNITTTVGIKLSFQQYDCVPGPRCREFRRNLLQLGAMVLCAVM